MRSSESRQRFWQGSCSLVITGVIVHGVVVDVGYSNEAMRIRCACLFCVSPRSAIPTSSTIPLRTLSTAVAAPAGARYQSLSPITIALPRCRRRRAPASVAPGRRPSIPYLAFDVDAQTIRPVTRARSLRVSVLSSFGEA